MVLIAGLWLLASACQSARCADGIATVDGTCVPDGGLCDPCGDHQYCEATVVPNECRCVPGYEGDPCQFTGLILNPDFDKREEPLYWDEGDLGAVIEPIAPGSKEGKLGVASLPNYAICDAASLTQVVKMPSYATAQRHHVMELIYHANGVHGLAVGFDRAWRRLPATGSGWSEQEPPPSFCLGEGAYGRAPEGSDVAVRISASERQEDCVVGTMPGGSIRVDRVWIRQAAEGECIDFGEVRNGEVLPDGGGWRFTKDAGIEGKIEPGKGVEGASGAWLFRDADVNDGATMTTEISVPLPKPDEPPALRFWWKGSSQQRFQVELGTMVGGSDRGRQVATLVGSNAGLYHIYCLPPWTHGSVLDLSFSLTDDDTTEATELSVDNLEITFDPECGSNSAILDPEFEYAPNRPFGASVGSAEETVTLIEYEGDGALQLGYETSAADLGIETYVLVPESDEQGGPVVTFLSKAPSEPSLPAQWILGRSEVERDVVRTQTRWQDNEVCLPPEWADRWFRVQVRVASGASEGSTIDRELLLFDDFSVGTSSACPK
jgi:hypothetical protein